MSGQIAHAPDVTVGQVMLKTNVTLLFDDGLERCQYVVLYRAEEKRELDILDKVCFLRESYAENISFQQQHRFVHIVTLRSSVYL
jgi:hypothetical protein